MICSVSEYFIPLQEIFRKNYAVWVLINTFNFKLPLLWRSGRAFTSHAGDRCSIPGRDRPKSLKQVVTVQLTNARQQVWVSRVLEDYHYEELANHKTSFKCVICLKEMSSSPIPLGQFQVNFVLKFILNDIPCKFRYKRD